MKKGDFFWVLILGAVVFTVLYPSTNAVYKSLNLTFPYTVGFVKFFILATMGELLSLRIVFGKWITPPGLLFRSLIWGFLGIVIVLVFTLFSKGVVAAQAVGLLPGAKNSFAFAFFTSLTMNMIFAPTMMAFHRITDTYIDLYYAKNKFPSLSEVVTQINWEKFVTFVVILTIPIFWIPAHTITFLLPESYRVVMAAFLSIALGGILAFAKKRDTRKASLNCINVPHIVDNMTKCEV